MLKNTLKKLNRWYLEKFQDTTREADEQFVEPDYKSVISIQLKMSFRERLRFLLTGNYAYRLSNKEVNFIKNYKC
jgi:hypothetical protein